MGQSNDKSLVETTVATFQNQNLINNIQADTFLNDFISNNDCVKDVTTFLQDGDKKFELFLKYFIQYNYPFNHSDRQSRQRKATDRSRQQIKDDLDRLMYKQMFQTIDNKIEEVQEKVQDAIELACDISMSRNINNSKKININAKQMWQKLFGITNFTAFILNKKEQLQSYSSILNLRENIKKEEKIFLKSKEFFNKIKQSETQSNVILPNTNKEYFSLFNDEKQSSSHLNNYIGVILYYEEKKYLLKVNYQYSIYDYFYLSKNDKTANSQNYFSQTYTKILISVMILLNKVSSLSKIENQQPVQKLNQYSCQVLSLIELYLKFQKETMKEKATGFSQTRTNNNNQSKQFLKQFNSIYNSQFEMIKTLQQNNNQSRSKQSIFDKLLASSKVYMLNFKKSIQKIQSFKEKMLDTDVIYLTFNKFGEIQFISRPFQNQIAQKLQRIWLKNKKNLSDYFPQNSKLFSLLKKASKGQFNGKTIVQKDHFISYKIEVRQNGIIQKVQIQIQKQFDEDVYSSKRINSIQNIDSPKKDNRQKTVALNQENKILLNLQKQNPGISSDSWIGLFLKNNHNAEKRRSNIKHSSDFPARRSNNSIKSHTLSVANKHKGLDDMDVDDINIHLLKFNVQKLEPFVHRVFQRLQFYKIISDSKQQFYNCVSEIHQNYETHKNPFHNFIHGLNVMHSCYILGNLLKNKNVLSPMQKFALVFSGLCHDVGHTGFTNPFQIASRSEKALLYNDKSPLENHHASLTFQILRKNKNNFLVNLKRSQFDQFRKDVINNILYTDIKEHFELLKKFEAKSQQTNNQFQKEDYSLLTTMIIHSSDFAGNTKDFQINRDWADRVNKQFINQYRMEGQLGLPQTVFMKDLNKIQVLSKGQAQFLKIIVQPLYKALNSYYINHTIVNIMTSNIQTNIKNWQIIHEQIKNNPGKEYQLQTLIANKISTKKIMQENQESENQND